METDQGRAVAAHPRCFWPDPFALIWQDGYGWPWQWQAALAGSQLRRAPRGGQQARREV